MPNRVITKALAGLEDLLFGRGSVNQARAGGTYAINKLSLPLVLTDVAELATLDSSKFPFVAVVDTQQKLSFYEYKSGTGYVKAVLQNATQKSRGSMKLYVPQLTSIITANTPTKLLLPTEANSNNIDFTHSAGRLLYTGAVEKTFLVNTAVVIASDFLGWMQLDLAVNGNIPGNSGECTVPGTSYTIVRPCSWNTFVTLQPNDFIEVYVRNTYGIEDITTTVFSMSLLEA